MRSCGASVGRFLSGLANPTTRRSVAFYAVVGAAVHDVIRRGVSWPNGLVLLALAGVPVAGAILRRVAGDKAAPSDPS